MTPEEQQAFIEYGETALVMMVDKGSGNPEEDDNGALTNEEFEAKYGVPKRDVNYALILLDMSNESGNVARRNNLHDFFISILRKKQ